MVFLRTHQPYSGTEVLMETKLERIAEISARFANKCEIKKLNRIVGCVLLVLGAVTLIIKLV